MWGGYGRVPTDAESQGNHGQRNLVGVREPGIVRRKVREPIKAEYREITMVMPILNMVGVSVHTPG